MTALTDCEWSSRKPRVEDIGTSDGRPLVVGSSTVQLDSPTEHLEISVPVDVDPAPQATYGVFVHLDVTGDGEVEVGDAITTSSYPVSIDAISERIDVQLRGVGGRPASQR